MNDKKVNQYIVKKEKWAKELDLLRQTILACGLLETLKWGAPVYVDEGKNIVGIAAFKNYVGLWFFQGATLTDQKKLLFNAQEGKTNAMRQWRFVNFEEVELHLTDIEGYVYESVSNMKLGKVILPRAKKPLIVPGLLKDELSKNVELKEKFDSYNLTLKREFVAHLNSAKREETKMKRLDKIINLIFEGKGINDKYRKK
jgi:uncharacterized protein YdeI (YjbR/CyaY-like superfamily)